LYSQDGCEIFGRVNIHGPLFHTKFCPNRRNVFPSAGRKKNKIDLLNNLNTRVCPAANPAS